MIVRWGRHTNETFMVEVGAQQYLVKVADGRLQVEEGPTLEILSLAKTTSAGQVVDSSALMRRESRRHDHSPAPLASAPPLLFGGHRQLALENLALRQQLTVYKRTVTRPRLRKIDRLF